MAITWTVSNIGNTSELINGTKGLREWRAALAKMKAGVTPKLNLNIIGDSITEGMGTTDFRTKSYTNLIRSALAAKYGNVGNGLIPSWHPDSHITGTPWWTFTGTGWTNENTFGLTMQCKRSQTNGDKATIQFNGTGIKFLFLRGSACGTCTITIDGGAPTSYNFANGTTEFANVTTISGLTDGAHEAVITSTVAGGKYIWLIGAYEIKGTTGVQVNMCGRYGTQTASHYPDQSMQVAFNHFSPSLSIIALMSNDFAASIPVATYAARLQAIITRALAYGDVLLVSLGHRDSTSTYPHKDYAEAMKSLAESNNTAYLDIFNRWGGSVGATSGITARNLGLMDDVHPLDAGAQDIATAILRAIDQ